MKTWKHRILSGIAAILIVTAICTACKNGTTNHSHDWGEWVVTKVPTLTEVGEETRICNFDPAHIEKRSIPSLVLNESIDEIIEFLDTQTGGNAASDPIPLIVSIEMGTTTEETSGWQLLLNAIEESGKYVELDLSSCEMDNAVFNPDRTIQTGKDKIVSLVLPSEATEIPGGRNAANSPFSGFTTLESISGMGITSIGQMAFTYDGNESLTEVSFPAVTDIGYGAFANCTGLTKASFPTVTDIGSSAFENCTSLTEISFSAEAVIGMPFTGCSNLTKFNPIGTGPLSTLENGKALVHDNTELVAYPSASGSIVMAAITCIGASAFYGNTSLTKVDFPAVTSIGPGAGTRSFMNCINLTEGNL